MFRKDNWKIAAKLSNPYLNQGKKIFKLFSMKNPSATQNLTLPCFLYIKKGGKQQHAYSYTRNGAFCTFNAELVFVIYSCLDAFFF